MGSEGVEREAELVQDLVAHDAAHADSSRLCNSLYPRRDVDTIAKYVVAVDDDVANIDTDAKFDPLVGSERRIAFSHSTLHIDGTAHRIHHAGEFQEQTVAGGLDDATTVLNDFRVD